MCLCQEVFLPLTPSSSSHSPPRHLPSSATGKRTCCGEMAQKAAMSFGWPHRKANPCWRLGLQSTLEVPLFLHPARRGLAPQEPVGTHRTGPQGHSCPLSPHPDPLHAAAFPWRSPGWDDPQPGWHRSQSALHLFKDFHLRISCQPKVTDNRVMTRICWNTLRLCFSTLGC